MADNYIDVTLSEIFGTGVASVEQTETSAEPGGYNVWTITLTNGHTSTFTVRNGTAGGSPMPVLNSVDMVDTTGIYLYLGNEEGYVTGHWYCYANDAWTDYGAYSEKGDPGLAPTVEVSKTGGTTTITITDAEGEHVAYIEDGISPTVNVANTAADMTDTSLIYVYAGSESAYNNGDWYFYDSYIGQWRSGGQYQSTVPRIDQSLTVSGAAADSKKVGDELSDLKSEITNSMPREVKLALDTMLLNMAVKDDDVFRDEYAVFHAWASAVNLVSISAVFTQGANVVYDTDTLDSLKQYLVVTATYDDETTAVVTTYTLSGDLTEGTSTITATYEGESATFNVNVTRLELKVFVGKGTNGTEIVDNANRALSAPVPYTNATPITIQYPDISYVQVAFKNTTPDVNTIDSTGVSMATADQLGKTSAQIGETLPGWVKTNDEYFVAGRSSASDPYTLYAYSTSSGYMRVTFAVLNDTSSPITETIEGVIIINGTPYHLVESSDPFE